MAIIMAIIMTITVLKRMAGGWRHRCRDWLSVLRRRVESLTQGLMQGLMQGLELCVLEVLREAVWRVRKLVSLKSIDVVWSGVGESRLRPNR